MLRTSSRRRALRAALLTALQIAARSASAGLPPEDSCPTISGMPGAGGGIAEDAIPARLREGMLLSYNDVLLLTTLLPVEVWRNREQFFHDGMRLEVGPCHRRYAAPEFFDAATRRFAGQARTDKDGNLENHTAGVPFPPDSIDPKAPDAALRWAWNFERRYRGAGQMGSFRLVDMPSEVGGIQTYEGDWFWLQTRHRADLPDSDYALPDVAPAEWVAGGTFKEPQSARFLAWRQIRPLDVALHYSRPDDTFVYVPTMRKSRRAASAWVDGLYMPRYRVSGDFGGGGIPIGGAGAYGGGAVNPTAGESIAVTENLRRGFTGLSLRPNAYDWRMLDEREVLAPINTTRSGYPEDRERNFGPSGLSLGNDRWDVRYAVVIQGVLKERGRDYDLLTLWIDYQTQQPLYVMTRRKTGAGQQLLEVGVLAHRYSGDLSRYPDWPDGKKASVFDPVAEVFFDSADGRSGWRRESYDVKSVPPPVAELRRLTEPSYLEHGR
jgi:hypothetical protein